MYNSNRYIIWFQCKNTEGYYYGEETDGVALVYEVRHAIRFPSESSAAFRAESLMKKHNCIVNCEIYEVRR